MLYRITINPDGPHSYTSGSIKLVRGRVAVLDLTEGQKADLVQFCDVRPASPPRPVEAPVTKVEMKPLPEVEPAVETEPEVEVEVLKETPELMDALKAAIAVEPKKKPGPKPKAKASEPVAVTRVIE